MTELIKHIDTPEFPPFSVNILDFNAVSDRLECQTNCIQSAINAVSAHGGGTVNIPTGRFLTGALCLKDNVNLHFLCEDSVLLFTTDINETNYPIVYSHWEAAPCYNYSALIYANGANNIAITGSGIMDAQSDYSNWWSWHHQVENAWSTDAIDLQNKARMAHRKMNMEGIPIDERRFGDGHFLRPNFVQLIDCDKILLDGITLKNSPMWQLNPVRCSNVTIRNMTLSAHGPNSDGCDPESCNRVLIENNYFDTGDDCISIKSGRDRDGRNAPPSKDIVIRNNIFADGHGGIALGSEMSGGISDIYAAHNRFESPNLTYILRFKSNARRGGYIERIWLHDTIATAVHGAAIHATMLYEDGRNGEFLPYFSDICIDKLYANGGDYGIFVEAFKEVPIKGLILKDITIENTTMPIRAMNWDNPILENVTINNLKYPRPTETKIKGLINPGNTVIADSLYLGGNSSQLRYTWSIYKDDCLMYTYSGNSYTIPSGIKDNSDASTKCSHTLSLCASSPDGQYCDSIKYRIIDAPYLKCTSYYLSKIQHESAELTSHNILLESIIKLLSINILNESSIYDTNSLLYNDIPDSGSIPYNDIPDSGSILDMLDKPIERAAMAQMLYPLYYGCKNVPDLPYDLILNAVIKHNQMSLDNGQLSPHAYITRQVMASIAMQSCGVSYKNASSTMPVCNDIDVIPANYGTNIARAIYFGFMTLDENQCFNPSAKITYADSLIIICKVAEFAGLL